LIYVTLPFTLMQAESESDHGTN